MMQPDELRERFANLNLWQRGSERAPHKPLLLLLALGKCQRGEPRLIPYAEVDRVLLRLLREFGPPRQSYHPEYPFWRLQHDNLWELHNTESVVRRQHQTDAKKSELLKHHVSGGLPAPIYDHLRKTPRLLIEIAHDILERHFPHSLHEDILDAVGLDIGVALTTRSRRDPAFRVRVLTVYAYACAVCGFDVRLGENVLGLEAAHIKWHQAGGPDREVNGLALCALHHKLFDRGAFTLSLEGKIHVSEYAHGTRGLESWLLAFHDQPIRAPQSSIYAPEKAFIHWHRKEVFRGPVRRLE